MDSGLSWPLRLFSGGVRDRKSTRLNSSHDQISYAVFCLKKKKHDDGNHLSAHTRLVDLLEKSSSHTAYHRAHRALQHQNEQVRHYYAPFFSVEAYFTAGN